MSQNVGWATLGVIPSMKGFRSKLEAETKGDFAQVGRSGGREMGEATGREFGSTLKSMIGPALAGAGVLAVLRDTYTLAAEAEQSVGGVHAVFKEYSESVLADSEAAAVGLGLSANAYRELVTVSGALLKNKGMDDFATQARTLVTVGADLAAQFGGPTSQAVEALNAALRGESDPIERYAISLNDAAVQSVLAANGQKDLKGAALDQAKTQARLTLIMQQSADAQGAFGREAGTAANEQQKLTAAWEDFRTEAGEKVLPVATALFSTLREDGIPALEATGTGVAALANAASELPGPVKDAALAFVALKAAGAVGLTSALGAAGNKAGGGMERLRHGVTLTSNSYRDALPHTTRLNASMSATSTIAAGAAGGLRRGIGGVVGLLGGPWGLALTAGALALGEFWREHKTAGEWVRSLTGSLDEQTGAITAQTRQMMASKLEEEGSLKRAKDLGIALDLVTDAALGEKDAVAELNKVLADKDSTGGSAQYSAGTEAAKSQAAAIHELRESVLGESGAVADSRKQWERKSEALEGGASATDVAAAAMSRYKTDLGDARTELRGLMEAEQDRASDAISAMSDELGIVRGIADAKKDLKAGAGISLDTTKGQENLEALLSLASDWTSAEESLREGDGEYSKFRKQFLDVADAMGVPKKEAKELAEDLLAVPKSAPIEFQSEGYLQVKAEIADIKADIKSLRATEALAPIKQAWSLTTDAPEWTTAPAPYAPGTMINIHGDVRPADSKEFYADLSRRSRKKGAGGVAKP